MKLFRIKISETIKTLRNLCGKREMGRINYIFILLCRFSPEFFLLLINTGIASQEICSECKLFQRNSVRLEWGTDDWIINAIL